MSCSSSEVYDVCSVLTAGCVVEIANRDRVWINRWLILTDHRGCRRVKTMLDLYNGFFMASRPIMRSSKPDSPTPLPTCLMQVTAYLRFSINVMATLKKSLVVYVQQVIKAVEWASALVLIMGAICYVTGTLGFIFSLP